MKPRLNNLLFLLLLFFLYLRGLHAQLLPESIRSSYSEVGISAISINTITAKTLFFDYPIYDCHYDSTSNLIFLSGKQKNDHSSQLMSRNYFMAINGKTDSVKWLNESTLYDIELVKGLLLLSNETRTTRYNKLLGFDEQAFASKLLYPIPNSQLGLFYSKNDNLNLQCVNLKTAQSIWTTTLSGLEDWVDVSPIKDSIFLIAASGLNAFHIRKGLLWSHPRTTSTITNKSLVYSLANNKSIAKVSAVVHTATDENRVTQLASNVLFTDNFIYFASKEKVNAFNSQGEMLWETDLRNYPTSKMFISKTGQMLILVNFGVASHSSNFVNWGKPFILIIDALTGNMVQQYDLSKITNLADFMATKNSLIFAGKDEILNAIPGENELKTILALDESKYGRFVEFIDGNLFYTIKEGYYVPLNFINDNLIYFRTDNNKIYGIEGDYIQYEYHYTELFKLQQKFDGNYLLTNAQKSVITSSNFELLFSLNLNTQALIGKNKIYFIGEKSLTIIDKDNLK